MPLRAQSALAYSEAAFYILDATMMLFVILIFTIIWAPKCLDVQVLPRDSGVTMGLGLDVTGVKVGRGLVAGTGVVEMRGSGR